MRKKTKFLLLRVSILAAFTILAGRLWYVQVVNGNFYRAQADTSKLRNVPVEALRGIIYDRNGRQLVWNAPSWNVQIVPHGIPRLRAWVIYRNLSRILGGRPTATEIADTVRRYSWRPYEGAPIEQHVSTNIAMVIKQLHYQLPGVRVDPTSVRAYVQDPGIFSLAHIMGYTSSISPSAFQFYKQHYHAEQVDLNDQAGAQGVEASVDPFLHGVNGTQQVEVDAGERPIRVVRRGQAVPGDSVFLTINWKLQQRVAADLRAGLNRLSVTRGVAILEDVNSGQILSMVSLPSYNNNLFSVPISQRVYSRLQNSHALLDLATQGMFPPGSTYKIITAAAALQTGVANVDTTINDTGQIKPCATCQPFHGWKASGLGPVNVVRALAMSSDIYFYTVTGGNPNAYPNLSHIGGARLAYWARQFGLGQPTGIELPESLGFVPTPHWFNSLKPDHIIKNPGDTWSIGYDYNSSIGQGFDLATPLQMVNVAATIANGGTLYQPRIIKSIYGRVLPQRGVLTHPQFVQPFVPTMVRRGFIDPYNIGLIQEGMHQSVTHDWNTGTGYYVYDPRIDAAGKTGTAEATGGAHAWWVGYAPFNNPKVAVIVMIPNANSEGAYAAAPIAHKVLEDYFHLSANPNWLADVQTNLVGSTASQ